MAVAQQAAQLLDFSQKFDVGLLDAVVVCGLGGTVHGPEVWLCGNCLFLLATGKRLVFIYL